MMAVPACRFRRAVGDDRFWCDSPKVMVGQSFAASMCQHCTIAEAAPGAGTERRDFFAATNKLKANSFSSIPAPPPEPVPEPATTSCKPCSKRRKGRRAAKVFRHRKRTIRRRDNSDGNTVVWVYWEAGAETNELQYSMASVMENLSGHSNLVICGDRPAWWNGPFISCPRVKRRDVLRTFGSGRFQKWCDSIIKMWAIIESDLVTENFLWMYDDTFIVKPYTFDAISQPVAQGYISLAKSPNSHTWREVKRRTGRDLAARGLPVWDYSTHHPVTFNKLQLVDTINTFDLPASPRLIESIYSNHHNRTKPARALNTFQYVKRVQAGWVPRDVPVINVGRFNDTVRTVLESGVPNILKHIETLKGLSDG